MLGLGLGLGLSGLDYITAALCVASRGKELQTSQCLDKQTIS